MLDIENWVSLRHSPRTKRFYDCGPTKTHDLFDWVVWSPLDDNLTRMDVENPKTILCLNCVRSIHLLTLNLKRVESKPNVVFAGLDATLSKLRSMVSAIEPRVNKIFFEAKDIESDRVNSFSMGFISYYLRDSLPESIYQAISYSDEHEKTKSILAAWGQRWKILDNSIDDRALADDFLNECDFLSRTSIPFSKYWQELAKYRFLLAPKGQGVQSPKLAEAWMVKVIPIVTYTPCFADLKKLGYPIIIINNWAEITQSNIAQWTDYYHQVDWQKTRFMLTNDFLKSIVT